MNVQRMLVSATIAAAGAAVVLMAVPALAHHSSAPFYDATKRVEAQGPVTKFLFKNPHSFLYFEEADAKGKVEWQVELGAAAGLTRTGWTPETLKPGTDDQGQRPAVERRRLARDVLRAHHPRRRQPDRRRRPRDRRRTAAQVSGPRTGHHVAGLARGDRARDVDARVPVDLGLSRSSSPCTPSASASSSGPAR